MARKITFTPWAGSVGVIATVSLGALLGTMQAAAQPATASFLGSVGSGIPISSGYWDGGHWDLRTLLTGQPGTALSSTLTSQTSAAVITQVGAPLISRDRIGGNRCIYLDGVSQYLRCDALASIFNGSDKTWTIAVRYRSTGTGTQAIVSAGSSAGATDNFLQVRTSTLQRLEVRKDAAAEATITRTGTIDQVYDEHVLVVSSNGTTVNAWLDGVADTLDSSSLDALSIAVDRFAIGALLANSASQFFAGFIQCIAISSSVATLSDAQTINNVWRGQDLVYQESAAPKYMFAGDSITQGDTGNDGGGFRDWQGDLIDCNGLSYNMVGSRTQGQFPDREHSAQGGNAMSSIEGRVLTDIATNNGVDVLQIMMGTNNMDDQPAATSLTEWNTRTRSMVAANHALKPAALYILANIPKIHSPQVGFDQVDAFNAGLPALVSAIAADYPTAQFIFWDAYSAATSLATDYADNVHWNTTGYQKAGASLAAATASALIARSPTRAALAVNITSPVGGASLTQNVQVTLTGTVSRTTAAVIVKDDQGDTLGTATVAAPDGDAANTTWSLNWTPLAGDVGLRTLHAEATDSVGGATANSPNVVVTVAAPAAAFSDYGTLVLWNDMGDVAAYAVTGADVTSMTNKVSGIVATEATNPPAYEATGGPNSKPCVTFDKAASERMISATDATAAGWLVGSQKPFTWIGYVKLVNLSDTVFWFSIAGSATANQGLMVGQQTTNKWRCFRQDSAANTSNQLSVGNTASGWHIVSWRFDGTNVYFGVDGVEEAPQAAALAGSIAGCNRWGWGCRGDSVPDTFGSVSMREAVLYSNDIGTTNLASAIALMTSRSA